MDDQQVTEAAVFEQMGRLYMSVQMLKQQKTDALRAIQILQAELANVKSQASSEERPDG